MVLKKYTLIFVLILLIILLNFRFLAFDHQFYEKEFDKNSLDKNNLDKSVLEYNKNILFNYFKDNGNLDNSFFNEREKLHLKDVKYLMQIIFICLYTALIIFAVLLSYLLYKKDYLVIACSFIVSGAITVFLLLIVSLFDFSNLFYNFHLLVFNNDLWLLDPLKDNLIKMFPEYFFYDFFKSLVINSVLTSLFLIAVGLAMKLVLAEKKFKNLKI